MYVCMYACMMHILIRNLKLLLQVLVELYRLHRELCIWNANIARFTLQLRL